MAENFGWTFFALTMVSFFYACHFHTTDAKEQSKSYKITICVMQVFIWLTIASYLWWIWI